MIDYNDPLVEENWCKERYSEVTTYLTREGVKHGRIGEWPAWHLAPYVSVWAIESTEKPGRVGWWVICGDVPNDYISAEIIRHPKDAIRGIAKRWQEAASSMAAGLFLTGFSVGRAEDWPTLAPMLASRAETLIEWANDESLWEEDPL